MEVNFNVKRIERANKAEAYVVTVTYGDSHKEYNYVRRAYPASTGFARLYVVIKGYKVFFNKYSLEYIDKEFSYEVQGFERKDTVPEDKEETGFEAVAAVEEEEEEFDPEAEVFHEKYETIRACIDSNIPVYLAGPAGSGKNFTVEQIAGELGFDFHFTNSVQQEYGLTGFIDAGGTYHETEFYRAFTQGGIFFLDEMDASIPEVLVLLNAAIANGYFEFPTGKVNCHEAFRVVAAGNTVGSGADEQYTGRMCLDQATLDRFVIIEFDYSEKIELQLAKGNKQLVAFIRALRLSAKQQGVRSTFSYRCIIQVTKLEGKLPLQEILAIAVIKGMDSDTVRTLVPVGQEYTTYGKALKALQR